MTDSVLHPFIPLLINNIILLVRSHSRGVIFSLYQIFMGYLLSHLSACIYQIRTEVLHWLLIKSLQTLVSRYRVFLNSLDCPSGLPGSLCIIIFLIFKSLFRILIDLLREILPLQLLIMAIDFLDDGLACARRGNGAFIFILFFDHSGYIKAIQRHQTGVNCTCRLLL